MCYIDLVRAKEGDVEDYIRIGKSCASRFNTVATDPEEVMREIEESVTIMIRIRNRTIGLVSYVMLHPAHAYISEVQVEPEFQGRGIGGNALALILSDLKDIETIDLHTHPENPAQKLYRRHGFCETGEIVENYHDTGESRMRMLLVRV